MGSVARGMDEAFISLAAIYGTAGAGAWRTSKMIYNLGSRVHYWMVRLDTAELGRGTSQFEATTQFTFEATMDRHPVCPTMKLHAWLASSAT
jgi:hypothetical protein